MTGIPDEEKPLGIQGTLGLGLDGDDGERRITRGENFYLYGGSEPTHRKMRETTMRFNDKVDERGKELDQINSRELREISRELREEMDD